MLFYSWVLCLGKEVLQWLAGFLCFWASAWSRIFSAESGNKGFEECYGRFCAEVGFEQVLYCLALHAQSRFTAAAGVGRRDELVLPGGRAADLLSATLLMLLRPFQHIRDLGNGTK